MFRLLVVVNFVSGFGIFVSLELVIPGFLSVTLLGKRFPFVALKETCALFNLSLGYDFRARRSELVALRTTDLEFTKDGALKGMIRKSKTDQYGRGWLVFGSERRAKLLIAWFRKKPKEVEAVFCVINHGQCLDRPICDRNVNEIIKKSVVKVKRCERPSDLEVSGHSLRVGAAQDLLIKGYDLAAIMRAGDWSNAETVSRYFRFSRHNIWK